jgi:hypothetical protein
MNYITNPTSFLHVYLSSQSTWVVVSFEICPTKNAWSKIVHIEECANSKHNQQLPHWFWLIDVALTMLRVGMCLGDWVVLHSMNSLAIPYTIARQVRLVVEDGNFI